MICQNQKTPPGRIDRQRKAIIRLNIDLYVSGELWKKS